MNGQWLGAVIQRMDFVQIAAFKSFTNKRHRRPSRIKKGRVRAASQMQRNRSNAMTAASTSRNQRSWSTSLKNHCSRSSAAVSTCYLYCTVPAQCTICKKTDRNMHVPGPGTHGIDGSSFGVLRQRRILFSSQRLL